MRFFSTLNPKNSIFNKLIINSIVKFSKNNVEDSVDIVLDQKFNLSSIKFSHIRFLLGAILAYKKRYDLTYKSYKIGIFVVSWAYRSSKSYKYKIYFLRRFIIGVLRACIAVDNILKEISRGLDFAILDNSPYINGIFFEILSDYEIPLFSIYEYPYSVIKNNFNTRLTFHQYNVIEKFPNDSKHIERGLLAIKARMLTYKKNHSDIDGFEDVEFCSSIYDYVIYVHAFTDAQHQFGFDGIFDNAQEWLLYTINKLKHKKVCIKAHPDFFRKWQSEVAKWDCDQTKKIQSDYEDSPKSLTWEIRPIPNYDFLMRVNKDAILISHHGNAVIEGAFFGFKSISSVYSPYSKYSISNYWSTLDEYDYLLGLKHDNLRFGDFNDLGMLGYRLIESPESYYNENGFMQALSRELGCTFSDLESNLDFFMNEAQIDEDRVEDLLSKKIINLSFPRV